MREGRIEGRIVVDYHMSPSRDSHVPADSILEPVAV